MAFALEVTAAQKCHLLLLILGLIIVTALLLPLHWYCEHLKSDLLGARWLAFEPTGRLLFTYRGNVYRLDLETEQVDLLIETGLVNAYTEIMDIAVSPGGEIYLSDPHAHTIRVYAADGKPRRDYPGQFVDNGKLAVDNQRVYIADMQWGQELRLDRADDSPPLRMGRVIALDAQTGARVWENRNWLIPESLDVRGAVVYVADLDDRGVRQLEAGTGRDLGEIRIAAGLLDYLYGSTVLVTKENALVLSPTYQAGQPLRLYSRAGELLATSAIPDQTTPLDLAISPHGRIVLSDDEHFTLLTLRDDRFTPLTVPALDQLYGSAPKRRAWADRWSGWSFRAVIFGVVATLLLFIGYLMATPPRNPDSPPPAAAGAAPNRNP